MNNFDPKRRFTPEAIKAAGGDSKPSDKAKLSSVAQEVAAQYRRDTMSPVMVSGILRLGEFALLFVSGLVLYAYHIGFLGYLGWQYPLVIMAGSFAAIIFFEIMDCYQLQSLMRPGVSIGRMALCWAITFALMAVTAFFMKVSADFSRLLFGTWFIAGLALLVGLRLIMARVIRRWARNGRMERRAVIVGGGKAAEVLIRSIEQQPYNDIRICGIFDDRDDKRSPPIVAGYPKLGTVSELLEFARIARIDMLIVSLPLTAETRVLQLLKKLWVLPVDIRLSAHSNQLQFRPRS
jgi:FlaA1/EpsC-like NDP-sugar epimerase